VTDFTSETRIKDMIGKGQHIILTVDRELWPSKKKKGKVRGNKRRLLKLVST